jgi:hypothetical protein
MDMHFGSPEPEEIMSIGAVSWTKNVPVPWMKTQEFSKEDNSDGLRMESHISLILQISKSSYELGYFQY